MNKPLFHILLSTALVASLPVVAAESTSGTEQEWVEEVHVVAARATRPLQDVAAHVDVIHHDNLVEQIAVSLADTVRYVPGISVASAGSRFGDTEFAIRGLSGNRVVSLIDGVPVADQFDVGAFANAGQDWLIPDSVSRMEVLRGPASTLFGSDALGGVVAVVSRDAEEYLLGKSRATNVNYTYSGADESNVANAAFASRIGSAAFVLHVNQRTGHERESSASRVEDRLDRTRQAVVAKAQYELQPGHELKFRADVFREETESDLVTTLGYGRRYRNTTDLQGDDSRSRRALSLIYEFAPETDWLNQGALSVYWQNTKATQRTYESRDLARTPIDLQRRFVFDIEAKGINLDLQSIWYQSEDVAHYLGWGVHHQSTNISEYRDGHVYNPATDTSTNVMLGEVMPVRDFPKSEIVETGFYLHDEIKIGRLTLIPGLRFERHRTEARSDVVFGNDNSAVPVVDDSHSQWVPKLGATWKFSDSVNLYAQYAKGFRAPPFEDVNIGLDIPLFNYRAIPNPDLKSETSDGVDVGLRVRRGSVRVDGSLFYARYDNFIQSRVNVGVDPVSGATMFQSLNIEEAQVSGAELSVAWQLGNNLAIATTVNYTRGEDTQSHEPLTTVDPLEMVSGVTWQTTDKLRVAVHGTFVKGQRRMRSTKAQLTTTPGYGVWDLTALYEMDGKTKFTLGIFNVADKEHWRWASVRNRAQDDPLVDVLAEPGRHVSMGIHRVLGG